MYSAQRSGAKAVTMDFALLLEVVFSFHPLLNTLVSNRLLFNSN